MIILSSLLLVFTTVGLYSTRFLFGSIPPTVRAGLSILRAVWFVFLVWLCLADPQIIRRETVVLKPLLPVVIDDSESMALPAVLSQPPTREPSGTKWEVVQEIVERGDLAGELRKRGFEDRIFRLSELDRVSGKQDLSADLSQRPSLSTTNLRSALDQLSAQFPQNRCPGFLFLTDGQWNTGGDPLRSRLLREATPPFAFYAIGVGDPHPPTDLRLVSISAPPTMRSGRMGAVTLHGDAEAVEKSFLSTLRLELRTQDGEVAWATETALRFEPGSVRWHESVRFPAMQAGKFQLAARISPPSSDINPENNESATDIQILEDQDRVLMLTGGPDWDFKLIKRALEADPLVTLRAVWTRAEGILLLGDRAWVERAESDSGAAGDQVPAPVEDHLEDLQQWSVLFLHGLPLGGQQSVLRDRIADYVENGGALVVLPGGSGKSPDLYWPCDPSKTQVVVLDGDAGIVPEQSDTASLLASPVHSALREDTPPLARSFSLVPPLSGAQAVLSGQRPAGSGRSPLIVEMRHGLGRVVHVYSDTFWRWRMYSTYDQDDPFGRFWRVLVHLLSPSSVPKMGRLVVDNPSPRAGQQVEIILELTPDSELPPAPYRVTVQGPEGTAVLPLAQDPVTPLRSSAGFVPSASGTYTVREERLGYEAHITVSPFFPEEKMRPAQNVSLLTALAASTGGAYGEAREWRDVLDRIPVEPTTIERERQRFWASRFWVLACIIGLLTAEWFLRQRHGLP